MRSVQATKQQLVTVCRRYSAYTLLAAGMVTLAGCGGGGSAGISDPVNTGDNITPTVTPTPTVVANTDTTPLNPLYKGKREQARLTESVALDFLALGSFERADGDISIMPQALLDAPFILSPGTATCQLGGTYSWTMKGGVSDDGLSGTHVFQHIYDKCQTKAATINGSDGVTKSYDQSKNTTDEKRDYDFTITDSLSNIVDIYNGSISLKDTGVKQSNNQDIYVKEKNVEVLKVNLQRLSESKRLEDLMTEISGRMYIGDYGYVTPKVLQTLYFDSVDLYAGELILNGANNTKAQILPTSSKTFVLNTDEDGDGGYEKTRIVNWADL